jgi:hypothetical protein
MRSYMEAADKSCPGTTRKRFEALIEATYDNAVNGGKDGAADRRLLYEYTAGKAPKAPEEMRLAMAEHLRQVEADRFGFAIQLLGDKLRAMSDDEKKAFFAALCVPATNCIDAAGKYEHSEGATDDGPAESAALPVSDSSPETGGDTDGSEPKP